MLWTGAGHSVNPEPTVMRPWQSKAAERATKAIEKGKAVLLDAPTGSGKTLIALTVASNFLSSATAGDVLISFRTVNEMTPYERDIERFFSGTKSISSRSYLLGKRRTCPFYQEGDDQNSRLCKVCLGMQAPQSQTSLTSRRMKSDPQLIASRILSGYKMANLQREYVVPPAGDDEGVCLYHSLRGASSSVTLMTYPYLLSKNVREGLKRINLPGSLLILDEAHNVENAATDLFEFRLSCERIERMKDALDQLAKGSLPLFHDGQFAERARGSLASLYEEVQTEADVDTEDDVGARTKLKDRVAFLERVRKVPLEELVQASSTIQDARAVMLAEGAAGRTISDPFFPLLNFVRALEDEGLELFSEGNGTLSLKLVDPAENLSALNEAKALIMMSGTMPGADYVSKVWGLEREIEEIRVERDYAEDYYAVFPKDARRFELVDSVTTRFAERAESTWERYAYIIDVAYSSSEKNVLVCVPSYSIAEKVSRHLRIPHIREWKMTGHEEVLRKLQEGSEEKKRYAMMSVAHGKLVEGIEFVDEERGESLIDTVVIAGIPYPVPDAYLRRKAERILKRLRIDEGSDDGEVRRIKSRYFLMQPALMVVRQAIGRAIRTPTDRATIYLADSRFDEPFWREELMGQQGDGLGTNWS